MKKVVALMLAMVMLLSVAAFAGTDEYLGTWYLNEMVMGDVTMAPGAMGMEMTLEIMEGGTGTMTVTGEEGLETAEITWTEEDDGITVVLVEQETPMTMTLADGNLVADNDGAALVFGRELSEANVFTPAQPAAEATIEDYAGEWTSFMMDLDGMYLDPSFAGITVTASVEGTTVTVNGLILNGEAVETTFADGALTFADEDPENALLDGLNMQLLEDGTMAFTMTFADDMTFIMQKSE